MAGVLPEEGLALRVPRVVPEDHAEGVEEGRLAVPSRAVEDEELLLGGEAREAVAARLPEEGDEVVGAEHRALEEGEPGRRHRIRPVVDRTEAGDEIPAGVVLELPGAEIDGAVEAVEEPRVRVEVLGQDGDAGPARGDRLRRLDPGVGGGLGPPVQPSFPLAVLFFVRVREGLGVSADLVHHPLDVPVHHARLVGRPPVLVPDEPLSPGDVEMDVPAEGREEPVGIPELRPVERVGGRGWGAGVPVDLRARLEFLPDLSDEVAGAAAVAWGLGVVARLDHLPGDRRGDPALFQECRDLPLRQRAVDLPVRLLHALAEGDGELRVPLDGDECVLGLHADRLVADREVEPHGARVAGRDRRVPCRAFALPLLGEPRRRCVERQVDRGELGDLTPLRDLVAPGRVAVARRRGEQQAAAEDVHVSALPAPEVDHAGRLAGRKRSPIAEEQVLPSRLGRLREAPGKVRGDWALARRSLGSEVLRVDVDASDPVPQHHGDLGVGGRGPERLDLGDGPQAARRVVRVGGDLLPFGERWGRLPPPTVVHEHGARGHDLDPLRHPPDRRLARRGEVRVGHGSPTFLADLRCRSEGSSARRRRSCASR